MHIIIQIIAYLCILVHFSGCGEFDSQGREDGAYSVNLSTYGLLHPEYPVAPFLESLDAENIETLGLAVLGGEVFGNRMENLSLVLASGRVDQVVVYLTFAGCVINQTCQQGTVLDQIEDLDQQVSLVEDEEDFLLDRYRNALAEILPLIQEYPEIDWIVFPELESNLSPSLHNVLIQALSNIPDRSFSLGYNPVFQASSLGQAEVYEGHRQLGTPMPCSANNDGRSISFPELSPSTFDSGEGPPLHPQEIKDYFMNANCNYNYVWEASLSNCLNDKNIINGEFLAPRKRDCTQVDGVEKWRVLIRNFKTNL